MEQQFSIAEFIAPLLLLLWPLRVSLMGKYPLRRRKNDNRKKTINKYIIEFRYMFSAYVDDMWACYGPKKVTSVAFLFHVCTDQSDTQKCNHNIFLSSLFIKSMILKSDSFFFFFLFGVRKFIFLPKKNINL